MENWSNLVPALTDLRERVIPSYFNPQTGTNEPVQGANGAAQVSFVGQNQIVGEQSASFPASTDANTNATLVFDLPALPQGSSLYLVTISIPSALNTSFGVLLEDQITIAGTLTPSAITTLTAPVGTTSYLVQGWLLGDGPALCVIGNTTTTGAAGDVTVQVRAV
jgi:hypothetical protein